VVVGNRVSNPVKDMRFACDAMLGRLARWLRLLGYDTFYSPDVKDDELLEICTREGLVLLTRDVGFFRRAVSCGLRGKLLTENSFDEQFARVVDNFGLKLRIAPDDSRCPACNGLIRRVDKNEIRSRVPINTFASYDSFWVCVNCGKVYWMGRMWRSMIRMIEAVRGRLKEK